MRGDEEHIDNVEQVVERNHVTLDKAINKVKVEAEGRFVEQEQQFMSEVDALREHMKELFHSMEEEMSQKIKHSHNSPIYLSAEDQKAYLRNQASALAKLSCRFENQSVERSKVLLEVPRDMCRAMSLVTQEMAEYIALKADVWAIEQMVHGAQEDQTYDDSTVEQRRERVFQNFMDLVMEEINRRHPDAGAIKLEARMRVIRAMQRAIEMALSKFDQVLVPGNSRLLARHLDVPKCITCDRPLWNRRNATKDDRQPVDAHEGMYSKVSRSDSAPTFGRPVTSVGFQGHRGQKHAPGGGATGPGVRQRPRSLEGEALQGAAMGVAAGAPPGHGPGEKGNFVMRGGFRMPKGQLSPEISAMMEPNFAKRQQRENEDVISGWEADEAKGPPLPALGATGGSKDASRR